MAAAASTARAQAGGALEVRQAVIRAPEMEVAGIMADTTTLKAGAGAGTEAARVAALWQAVKEGRARVISDLTGAVAGNREVSVRQGRHVWLPTELEQDTERLQMPPLAHGEYFVGTALECTGTAMTFQWKGVCVPRGPALVKWPVSWLNLWTGQKPDPQKRLIRGWLDFHDLFQQETTGTMTLRSPRMQILAVMPPADQVFPASTGTGAGPDAAGRAAAGPGRWLDVFLAQVKAPGQQVPAGPELEPEPAPEPAPAPALPQDPFAAPPPHLSKDVKSLPQGQANMFYGISIGTAEAATLLRQRDPAQDAALLGKLLARVRAGTARMHLCAGSGSDLQSRTSITSARLHQVPTEMPSIPSAWSDRPIGTTLEMEFQDFALHQDLAPPGRSEWKLALDDPQAIMWQPRPRFFQLQGETPTLRGTHLVGLLQIPEVMRQQGSGRDAKEPESILVFAQYHGGHALTGNANDDSEPPPFEAELIVLEMPGNSVDDFQGLPGDPQPGEEDERFSQLMSRVPTGEVRVAAHTLVTGRRGRIKAIIGEEHQHATEFDPPENGTPRMRPTALETVHAGTGLEMDVAIHNAPPFEIHVEVTFKHSLGLPLEPGLPATLAIAAKDESAPYPFGEHPQETWTSSDNHATTGSSGHQLRNNQPFCLGARKPPGVERRVIHVAYLRVRRL